MIEARITCLCQNIILADLGLRLAKGQIAYVDASQAKASEDLLRAARSSGVSVQYVQRAREVRKPSIANPRRGIIAVGTPTPPVMMPPPLPAITLPPPVVEAPAVEPDAAPQEEDPKPRRRKAPKSEPKE